MQSKELPKVITNHSQEVVLWEENGKSLPSLVQAFQESQMALLREQQQQNAWIRNYVFWGVVIGFFAIVIAAGFFYYLHIGHNWEIALTDKIYQSRRELAASLQMRIQEQDQFYKKELRAIGQQEKQNYQQLQQRYRELTAFLSTVQAKQQKISKTYHDRVLHLEKEKLALLQKNEKLQKEWTKSELKLLKIREHNQLLSQKVLSLQTKITKMDKTIKELQTKAAQRLSTEELETLSSELQNDDLQNLDGFQVPERRQQSENR